MFPVYVLSAGRAMTATTPILLRLAGVKFYVMTKPSESELYARKFPYAHILELPDETPGNAFSRMNIQKHSESLGAEYHWQIDDNIRDFQIRRNGRNVTTSARILLSEIEEYVSRFTNIGMAGPSYSVWAFGSDGKDPVSVNRQSSSCMMVRNGTGCYFRGKACVDTDLHMQMLTPGELCTLRFNRLLIDKMSTGTLKGGCTDSDYVNAGRAQACLEFVERWPAFKIKPSDPSRIAPSRIWDTFRQKPVPKEELCLT